MPSLIIRTKGATAYDLPLSARAVTLGRAETCDGILRDDAEVSREHVEIWLDDESRVLVADKNSKNGTRVDDGEMFRNDTRVAFNSIRVGEHEIEIVGAPPKPAEASTSVTFAPDAPNRLGDTHFFPSSKRLDLNAQRLALLISLTDRIGGAFEKKPLLEQALDACCDALGFERGLIVLKTPRGEPEPPVTRNVQVDETGAYKVSRTLINRALIEGQRAVVNNPATDLAGNLTESMVRFPICSALCVPIIHRDELLGAIYGDRVTQGSTYLTADVDFLAAIAQQVGVGLANLRMLREHVRSQRVYAELEQARLIQKRLLPAEPTQAGCIRAEGYNRSSSAVGGDYFDHFDLGEGRLGIVIADVTGHGLPAAIVMANLQAAVRVALSGSSPLPALAERINRLLCRNTAPQVFVTAIIGIVDTRSGVIEYVNAGHPGPILIHDGQARAVQQENSLPLGIDPDEKFVVRTIDPEKEAGAILFYTDGLTEAASPDGVMLGLPPVVDAVQSLEETTTGALLRTALALVRNHLAGGDGGDDMTLLALQFVR